MTITLKMQGDLDVTLDNEIGWDFEPFRNNKVKISQNVREFDWWINWIRKEFKIPFEVPGHPVKDLKPMKYLEIGSYAGESLFYLSQVFPRGSTITLIDLGDNKVARSILEPTIEFLSKEYGHKITLLSGLSDDKEILEKVSKEAPYDMVFIDANHDFEWAFKDYMNYRDKVRWVAFHDISEFNIYKTKVKYGRELANAAHLWKSITSVIPSSVRVCNEGPGRVYEDQVNWLEFIDYNNDIDVSKMNLKPRGIGVFRSLWV